MNRIDQLFKDKAGGILSIYCTAGFPRLSDTLPMLEALQEAGADMIELGMPYSDPLADGPVIQQSNQQAIANGMNMSILFEQIQNMRQSIRIPVLLMGYLNPVLQYGLEKFCAAASAAGVDGLIIPDLPILEYETEYQTLFERYGLQVVFLVTPETSEDRIRRIDGLCKGFLYAVSSSAVTGGSKDLGGQSAYFEKLSGMGLKNPVMVGFGIKNKADFNLATRSARGAIIGSAYIRALSGGGDIPAITKEFINGIKG